MKNNSFFRSIALLAALTLAVPVFAKPFSKTISLAQTAKLGKAELQAGEYRLQIDGNKATVQKGGKVVAETEGRWEDRSAKSSYDSLLISENGQVKEARFSGQARVFVFSEYAEPLRESFPEDEREVVACGRLPLVRSI